jgi:acetate---CoA ligase (ADP-forming)
LPPEEKKENHYIQIQEYITEGLEIIIGVKRDGAYVDNKPYTGFGHLILFGFGGIYTEVFKDISQRLTPLSRSDIITMVDKTKISKLLHGFRGKKFDLEGIYTTIENINRLVQDYPTIKEMDINPLIVTETSVSAVDLKIILSNQ